MAFDTPRGEEDKNKYKIFLLQDMITVKPNFCVCIDVKWNSCAKYVNVLIMTLNLNHSCCTAMVGAGQF